MVGPGNAKLAVEQPGGRSMEIELVAIVPASKLNAGDCFIVDRPGLDIDGEAATIVIIDKQHIDRKDPVWPPTVFVNCRCDKVSRFAWQFKASDMVATVRVIGDGFVSEADSKWAEDLSKEQLEAAAAEE